MNLKTCASKIIKNQFIANTNWLLFQNIYSMLLSLVVGSISARYLGPSNYGLIGYGASLVSLFTSVSQLGLNNTIINEILRDQTQKGKVLGTALVMRLVASLICFGCVLILVNIVEPGNKVLLTVVMLQAVAIIFNTYELLNEWFLSEMKSKIYVLAATVGASIVGIWKVTMLILGASVQWFAVSTTIQSLICGGIIFCIFIKYKDFKLHFSIARARELLSRSNHYIISGLAVTLYMQMDKVMLGNMKGEYEVGIYTSAMTIAMLWEFIPQSLINSSKVIILEKKKTNYDNYLKLFQILLVVVSLMGIVVGIGIQIFGKYIIWVLYGSDYMEAVILLQILIWSTGFAMIGSVRGIWNIAEDKNRYAKYFTIIGCVFNLIFNYFAIPVWGMKGAAWGTLLSQFIVALIAPLMWKDTRPLVKLYVTSWTYLRYVKEIGDKIRSR